MIVLKILTVIAFLCVCCESQKSEDSIFTVNTKKALHTVSDKFLSFTIDPAVLLTGFNLSDTSLKLARNLSPALIRIAGPSTKYVKYVDFEDGSPERLSEDTANIVVTPSMWLGINEWFSLANLTPVFGINDFDDTASGLKWNPKSTLPLLEISDKLNVTCYWQLGYDCSNKTELQYREDLVIFRHILDAFPDKKSTWKIIGSDLSKCRRMAEALPHVDVAARKTSSDLGEVLDAVVLESDHNGADDVDTVKAHWPFLRSKVPLWTTSSKPYHPVSFGSALSWAQELGDAAAAGFEVFFRQPRLHELFADTPVYWLSVLYKRLMGTHVLDIKPTTSHVTTSVYAHCSKNQNNFVRSGAMTVLAVNNGTTNNTVLLRFGNFILKTIEVQSYILTSPHEGSTDIHLNGNKLDMKNSEFNPKLRIAKLMNYLSLSLPPKSIGFFVLPSARVPVCINEEVETQLLLEEIYEDQHVPFQVPAEMQPRISHVKKPPSLKELHAMMEKELQSDERYYKRTRSKPITRGRQTVEEPKAQTPREIVDARNFFIERARLAEKQRKQVDSDRNKMGGSSNKRIVEGPKMELELELTNAEIRKVLAERAKAKAAQKNIIFTSRELDEIMAKATDKYLKNSNIKIKPKLKRSVVPASPATQRDKKDINMKLLTLKTLGEKRRVLLKQHMDKVNSHRKDHHHHISHVPRREKRDINLDLLKKGKVVTPPTKSKFHNNEAKEATIRDSAQTSAELMLRDGSMEGPTTPKDVFAGLASYEDPSDDDEAAVVKFNDFKSKQNLFGFGGDFASGVPTNKFETFGNFQAMKASELDLTGEVQYSSESLGIGKGDEDFPCIHEYFGTSSRRNPDKGDGATKVMMRELWEMSEMPSVEDKKDNHLVQPPAMAARGLLDNVHLENIESALRNHKFRTGNNENISPMDDDDYGDLADKLDDVRFKRDITKLDNDDLEENLKNQQIQVLKQRLYQHKVFNMLCKNHNDNQNDRQAKPSDDPHDGIIRTPLNGIIADQSPINKRYKSLTEGLKVWKPAAVDDVLNPKPNPIRSQRRRRRRRSRSAQMDNRENEIDFNDLLKDTQIIDAANDGHDYKLIFPNKDMIEIAGGGGGNGGGAGDRKKTEVKLVLHDDEEVPENVTITNPGVVVNEATEKSVEITTNEADNPIEKDSDAAAPDDDGGDGEKINGTMAMKRVQGHVQSIAPSDLWGGMSGMWRKVQGFFQDLGGKLKSCMKFLTGD